MATKRTCDPPDAFDNQREASACAASQTLTTVILLGPPGAGKTTQAKRLAATLGGSSISVGELVRSARHKLPRGRCGLADTQATALMIQSQMDNINDTAAPLVADGFPRSAEQVSAAIGLFGPKILCIKLEIPLTIALQRMLHRGRTGEDRPRIVERFTQHSWRERDLNQALGQAGIPTVLLDATGCQDRVAEQIMSAVNEARSTPNG